MKYLNKLFMLVLSVILLVTFTACNGKKENNSNSQGENSMPTVSTTSDTTQKESNSDTSISEESKTEENKSQASTSSESTKVQKDYAKLILGSWISKVDACEILLENEIELDGPILISFTTRFDADLSYSVDMNSNDIFQTLRSAISTDYDDDFIQNCVTILDEILFESGIYKFEDETLMIKWDGDPDYTEVEYTFNSNDDKLTLVLSSDVINYERKK